MAAKKKAAKAKKAVTVVTAERERPVTRLLERGRTGSFVLLSDLHAHPWAAFAKGDGVRNTRLQRALTILRASLQEAENREVPWVFAGDLVHTAGYTLNVVLAALTDIFMLFPDVPKVLVWGNHDARGIGGRITIEQTVLASLRRTVPNFHVLDPSLTEVWTDARTGLTYSGAGYQPTTDQLTLGLPADVGIYHQTVGGSKTPHGTVLTEGVSAAALFDRHRVIAVGHVHHWQYHEPPHPDQMLLIPGSPEHHNFGDVGEHGWWVVDVLAGAPPKLTFIAGGSPEFRTVDTPRDVQSDGHFYRVRSVPAGSTVPEGVVAIAPSPTTVQSRDVLRGARGEEAVEAWLRTNPPEDGVPVDTYAEAGRRLLAVAGNEVRTLRAVRVAKYRLENFCSYEDETVHVPGGLTLVLGRGRDFPSNGAGKTTLFEAVFWALFGRTTKGLAADEVVRRGTDGCRVTVWLEGGDGEWVTVTRSRGSYGTGLAVDTDQGALEAKSSTDLTASLGQYLGITPELYQALGYFSQERLLLFASSTDAERKAMLGDLLGLQAYQDAATAASREADAATNAENRALAVLTTSERTLESDVARCDTAEREAAAWDTAWRDRATNALHTVEEYRACAPQLVDEEVRTILADKSAALDERAAKMAATRDKAEAELATFSSTLDAELLAAESAEREAEALNATVTQARAVAQQAQAVRDVKRQEAHRVQSRVDAQAKKLASGECPQCNQPVSDEHRAACLAPLQAEAEAVALEVSAADAEVAQALEAVREAERVAGASRPAQQRVADLRAQVSKRRLVTDVLSSVAQKEEALQAERLTVAQMAREQAEERVEREATRLKGVADAVARERNPHTEKVRVLKETVAQTQRTVDECREQMHVAARNIAVAEYWRHGFSKQGLQSLLVDEVATLFNAARGAVFPALTQGVYDVQFSTVSQTKSGEWRERTEFQVLEHGSPVPYAALSGGQRRRIDVGVMLTLVLAVSSWMRVPGMLGTLILDEVFGFLDASGAEGLLEALREVQTHIPAVFVVSHDAQLQALFPEALVVVQDEHGVSRLARGDEA